MYHELTAYLSDFSLLGHNEIAILSKKRKADSFKSHNSFKLIFTNIRSLCLNFVDCESFLELNSPDILALYETNLDKSIDSGNFSLRGYFSLTRKDSITRMHGHAAYVKEGLPFTRSLSLRTLRIIIYDFD